MNDMHDLITEYLLQSEKCSLPGIGIFSRILQSARIDSVNKLIYPPYYQFQFDNIQHDVSKQLIEFISYRKNIESTLADEEIKNFCNEQAERIRQGEQLCFDKIGCVRSDEADNIIFSPEDTSVKLPVLVAEKVIHKDAKHNVLVGDRETNSKVMKDFYSEQPAAQARKWKLWAAILLVTGLAIIIFSLYNKGFTPDSIGNNHRLKVNEEPKTYKKIDNEQ